MMNIRRSWLHLASGAGVGRIFGFISNLLLSRWLGPIDLGFFNLVSTTVQTCDTLVRCGADFALNYELGGKTDALSSKRGIQLARAFTQICTLATTFICTVIAIWILFGQAILPVSSSLSISPVLSVFLFVMIASECCSVSAWEILLASHQTAPLALRQGLFLPMRLILAAAGSLFSGVLGAMLGWTIAALIQCLWLRIVLGNLWNPFQLLPILWKRIRELLRRGLVFYGSNLLSTIIFYPLFLQLAATSGLAEIGYLRVGQILQQLFSFLPATLVPVLFLQLRGKASFAQQVAGIEKPLRILWFILLEVILVYCVIDHFLIKWMFGPGFASALLPTRLLLLTALFECLSQLIVQPILASGKTRLYAFWQNSPAILAAVLGWLFIPTIGLPAFLVVRLVYVLVPLLGLGLTVIRQFKEPQEMTPLFLASIALTVVLLLQAFDSDLPRYMQLLFSIVSFLALIFLRRDDVSFLRRALMQTL